MRKAIAHQLDVAHRQHFVTTAPFVYTGSLVTNELRLALHFVVAATVLTVGIANAGTCEDLWQKISADPMLRSALDKADAMEQQGKVCMDDVPSIVRTINFYMEGKNLEKAESLAKSALQKIPSSAEIEDRVAFIALAKGDVATARELAQDAIRKIPSFSSPYFTLARIEVKSQNWSNALQYDRRAYELSAKPIVLLHIVMELHQLGHHEDAVTTAYRALKEDPSLIRHKLGIDEAIYSLGALGRFDEAKQLAKRRMAADRNWQQDAALVQALNKLKLLDIPVH